jgi:hypothetical protein
MRFSLPQGASLALWGRHNLSNSFLFGTARRCFLLLAFIAATYVPQASAETLDGDWASKCQNLTYCLSILPRGYLIATKAPDTQTDCYLVHTRLSQRSNGIACVDVTTAKINDTMIFVPLAIPSSQSTQAFTIESAYYQSQALLRGMAYRLSYMTRDVPGGILVDMNAAFEPGARNGPDYAIYGAWAFDNRGASSANTTAISAMLACSYMKLSQCVSLDGIYPNDLRFWVRQAQQDGRPGGLLRLTTAISSSISTPPQYFSLIMLPKYVPPTKLADDRPFERTTIARPTRTIYQKLEYPAGKQWVAALTEKGDRVAAAGGKRAFPPDPATQSLGTPNLGLPGVRIGLTWDASKAAFVLGEQLGTDVQRLTFAPFMFEGTRSKIFNQDGEGDFALVRPDNGQPTDIVVELKDDGTTILNQVGYKDNSFEIAAKPLCVGDEKVMVPCDKGSSFDIVWVRGGTDY